MNISINIKSGTGGHYDYDGCDLCIKEIRDDKFPIPRIGESIDISEENDEKKTNSKGEVFKTFHQYLVTDVRYWIGENSHGVTVYVVPIGRSVNK
jgi:hypothetical protein